MIAPTLLARWWNGFLNERPQNPIELFHVGVL